MIQPAVEFKAVGDQLHLIYRPRDDSEWVYRKFQNDEELVIKGTFHLSHEKLVVDDVEPIGFGNSSQLDSEELEFGDETLMAFVIATADGEYFRFDPDVLPLGIPVLLSKQAQPTWKWFSAERKVSILAIVADLKPSRIVIGGPEPDAIPLAAYEQLVGQLPTPHELRRYVRARAAAVVRQ